jgi:hypothetical protein
MRLFLGLFLALSGYVAAEPTEVTCAPKAPSAKGGYPFSRQTAASYEIPDQSLITDIIVTNLPVFDETNPDENNIIYRFANRFHILTRQDKISSQLLFKVDDLYDEQKTDESARILRSQKYLYDADIRPVSLCNNNVTMEVITRDVWSFTPEASFSRSGGENEFRLGVREINLFGTGVELAARHKKDIDRLSLSTKTRTSKTRGSAASLFTLTMTMAQSFLVVSNYRSIRWTPCDHDRLAWERMIESIPSIFAAMTLLKFNGNQKIIW